MPASANRLFAMATAAWLAVVATASADELASEPLCYDALVLAKVVRQTPTEYPDCGDDCIVMSWPWVVDLDVSRVLRGRAPEGVITALTIQHTEYRTGRVSTWWLRRNALGAFNVLRLDGEKEPPRCGKEIPPATPYVSPSPGKTLRDLRRKSERAYRNDR